SAAFRSVACPRRGCGVAPLRLRLRSVAPCSWTQSFARPPPPNRQRNRAPFGARLPHLVWLLRQCLGAKRYVLGAFGDGVTGRDGGRVVAHCRELGGGGADAGGAVGAFAVLAEVEAHDFVFVGDAEGAEDGLEGHDDCDRGEGGE